MKDQRQDEQVNTTPGAEINNTIDVVYSENPEEVLRGDQRKKQNAPCFEDHHKVQIDIQGLVVVATPIGNLEDITFRAVRILQEADLVVAEDTRHTLRLLNHFDIHKPMISCHDQNEAERTDYLIKQLREGKKIALVSDAGTPGISDPGEIFIREVIKAGLPVTMAPGPSAVIMAVVLSGLRTGKFCFEGFLPSVHKDRMKSLKKLLNETRTIVFYESPHRIKAMLNDCMEILGNRQCAVAREMTKKYEEFLRGSLYEMINFVDCKESRGEYVVVLEGANESEILKERYQYYSDIPIQNHIEQYQSAGMSRMDALKKAAKDRGIGKRDVYALLEKEKAVD